MIKFLQDYKTVNDLPSQIALFPLSGALLLPRADLPLSIFEPRYVDMISDAMSGNRLIGMIQPEEDTTEQDLPALLNIGCVGRVTSYAETQDRKLMVSLTGLCRFTITRELTVTTAYRQAEIDFSPYAEDLQTDRGAGEVNRPALLSAFKDYLMANDMNADWDEINQASTESLVNTLSLLAPYPPREKQALLEAPDLKTRADVLVALTEITLSRQGSGKRHNLQ